MTLLEKVKANLILEHDADDGLVQAYITAAVSYAESYQHIQEGGIQTTPCRPPPSRLLLCCHPTSMKAGMAAPVASSQIMCRLVNRYGTQSICF
jgi:hypothetical protein